MFDRLIVTEPEGANFKNRRSFFIASALVVGVLFLGAVVASIYAADFSLGGSSLELVEMLAPVETAVTPEEAKPQPRTAPERSKSDVPMRQVNMQPVALSTVIPTTTSTAPVAQMSRPDGRFVIGPIDQGPVGTGTGDPGRGTSPAGSGEGLAPTAAIAETPETTPPPVKKEVAPVKLISGGVVNGNAISLPKPTYSAAAIAVRAEGKVDVQVTIDENGKVISARAVSGHMLLRDAAEKAAWSARFSPTLLSKVPVKVTGLIVYNFSRG